MQLSQNSKVLQLNPFIAPFFIFFTGFSILRPGIDRKKV